MDREALAKALKEKNDDLFDLSKFGYEDIKIENCEIVETDGHVIIRPHRNRRKKKYIWQCQICNRFFLGRKDDTNIYVGNCFKKLDVDERQRLYSTDFKWENKIDENRLVRYQVGELLENIEKNNMNGPGVWALWHGKELVQVARNKNIYGEIWDDFRKGKGKINYTQYEEGGEIVIISNKNDFYAELQYAQEHRARFWNPSFAECKQIGIMKNLRDSH